jgi:hypothetical protein
MRPSVLQHQPRDTPCPTCNVAPQCSTCGATDIEPIVVCEECDGEKYYYMLQRWRDAAMVAQELSRPKWWHKLLRRKALPSALDEAIRHALDLEKEHGQ